MKQHLTTSPQHCQQLASEVGKDCRGKSSYLGCAEARSKAAAGIWTSIAARGGAGLSHRWLGLRPADKAASTGWKRIHPAASNSLEDFKDRKVDGLQLYGLLQQLLIRWALFHGWHLINVPPCVEVLQWEVEAAGGRQEGLWLFWWQWQRKAALLSECVLAGIHQEWKYTRCPYCNGVLFDVSNSIFT